MSAVKLHNFLYLSVPTTSQTHICTMKQRRTRIIRPQPRTGEALSRPALIGQSPGHAECQVQKGREAGDFVFKWQVGRGSRWGLWVGGVFSKEHKSQGLKSSITTTALAAGSVLHMAAQGSPQNADLMFATIPWLPSSTGQSPNSSARLQTLPCLGPAYTSPPTPPPYSIFLPSFIHSDACRPLYVPFSIWQYSLLHSFNWLTPSCLLRLR